MTTVNYTSCENDYFRHGVTVNTSITEILRVKQNLQFMTRVETTKERKGSRVRKLKSIRTSRDGIRL